eukprot:3751395-Amphidinium_carterae.1
MERQGWAWARRNAARACKSSRKRFLGLWGYIAKATFVLLQIPQAVRQSFIEAHLQQRINGSHLRHAPTANARRSTDKISASSAALQPQIGTPRLLYSEHRCALACLGQFT